MSDSPYPIAMFIRQETAYGVAYLPSNSLAVDLCGIAGVRSLDEDRMHYVRKRFKVIQPSGQPLPHPRQKVDEIA